jgi:Ca2+-binding EF-hand superfamily protein
MAGIPMTETEINALLDVLDKDGDGEINYRYGQDITQTFKVIY